MKKVKLINFKTGISNKNGKPYCQISVAFDRPDNERITRDFWVDPAIIKGIALVNDCEYYISADFDDYLRTVLGSIRPINKAD